MCTVYANLALRTLQEDESLEENPEDLAFRNANH